jgi:hypothetical protein
MIIPGYNVIHWEHFPENYGTSHGNITMDPGAKQDGETGKLNGFYFRWKIEISSEGGQLINFIVEDSYTLQQPLSSLTPMDILAAMKLSYEKFKQDFRSRIDILGYQFQPDFAVSIGIAEAFLEDLHQTKK